MFRVYIYMYISGVRCKSLTRDGWLIDRGLGCTTSPVLGPTSAGPCSADDRMIISHLQQMQILTVSHSPQNCALTSSPNLTDGPLAVWPYPRGSKG